MTSDNYGCLCALGLVIPVAVAFIELEAGVVVFIVCLVINAIIGFIIYRKEEKIAAKENEERERLEQLKIEEEQRRIEAKEREYQKARLDITKNLYPPRKLHSEQIIQHLNDNYVYCLYHFTNYENLESIKKYGGLLSWKTLEDNGIECLAPGGDNLSRQLDEKQGLEDFVRLSFCKDHPMAYRHIVSGKKMVLLKIVLDVATWADTLFTNMNATDRDHSIGESLDFIKGLDFSAVNQPFLKKTDINFKQHQAEVLVKGVIPKECIINLEHPDLLPQIEYEDGCYFESSRLFTEEEKSQVICAQVVKGIGDELQVCFLMKPDGRSYIPLSRRSKLKEGDKIDMNTVKVLTLSQEYRSGSFFFPEKRTMSIIRIEE